MEFHKFLNRIFIFLQLFCVACSNSSSLSGSPVLLVVLDGFRHDYLETIGTPNLERVWKKEGVLVQNLKPEFPASRLPFMASLLTGRHVQHHQVLSEEVFRNDKKVKVSADQKEFWEKTRESDLIWNLEKSSKVCNCWPYSHFLVDKANLMSQANETEHETLNVTSHEGTRMTSSEGAKSHSWEDCVLDSIRLLTDGKTKFISLYLDEPGRTAEIFGPNSKEAASQVSKVDAMIGKLLSSLRNATLIDKVNIIITSTPGFSGIRADRLVDLPEMINGVNSTYQIYGQSPVLNIKPNFGKELEVLVLLEKSKHNYEVHITELLPDDLFYKDAVEVVQPILLLANEGYAFSHDFAPKMKKLNQIGNRSESLSNVYGCSGYNNSLPDMQTFLIARGPDFSAPASNPQVEDSRTKLNETVRVVDVYTLLCRLLELEIGKETDGDISRLEHLLRKSNDTESALEKVEDFIGIALKPEYMPITISASVGGLVSCILMIICIVCVTKRRKKASNATVGYRYSQVKNNRRYSSNTDDNVIFSAEDDDSEKLQEQSLLTAVASEET